MIIMSISMIHNVKDLDGDIVTLKFIFISSFTSSLSAQAFDSKGRYFYAERFEKDLQYYLDKLKKSELNIVYDDFRSDVITIYLDGGEYGDCNYGLVEQEYDDKHLINLNREITETKNKLEKLQEMKECIEELYREVL